MNKVQIQSQLNPEIYQRLQAYMTEQGLSETMAIEVIISTYLTDKSENNLTERIAKIEQDLSSLKRHVLAVRFR